MSKRVKSKWKYFLRGLASLFAGIGGLSFLFGGGLIHAVAGVDRFLAEIIGIAITFICLIGFVIAKHVIDDLEWQEANEVPAVSETQAKS